MGRHVILLGVLLASFVPLYGQNGATRVEGWDFVVLPSLSYNTDMGFHYGLYGDLYYYGHDSLCSYPNYRHLLDFEVSRYTKGQSLIHLLYEGNDILPRTDITIITRWQKDPTMLFWGYNGTSLFLEYPNEYLLLDRTYFLLNTGAETRIAGKFKSYLGLAFRNFRMVNPDTSATHDGTLLSIMRGSNLIHDNEADGGSILDLKTGVLYDTRNHPTNPTRGYRIEAFATRSLDLSHREYNSLKINAQILQYYPLGSIAVIANRTAVQLLVAGRQPYYTLTTVNTMRATKYSSEGLGGVTSLRGMPLNALAADGFAWANTEARIRLFGFNLVKRSFDVLTNPFVDVGFPFKAYRVQNDLQPYVTIGMGGKLVVNQNFAFSVEAGRLLSHNASLKVPWAFNFSTGFIF